MDEKTSRGRMWHLQGIARLIEQLSTRFLQMRDLLDDCQVFAWSTHLIQTVDAPCTSMQQHTFNTLVSICATARRGDVNA